MIKIVGVYRILMYTILRDDNMLLAGFFLALSNNEIYRAKVINTISNPFICGFTPTFLSQLKAMIFY